MFSWSKPKNSRQRNKNKNPDSGENEFGIPIDKGPSDKQLEAELRALAGVDGFQDDDIDLNEAEEDEETELLRLIGGKAKKTTKKLNDENNVSSGDILGDITAEIDVDDDVEVDENDPDLLNELLELTGDENAVEEEIVESEEEENEPQPTEGGNILSLLKERIQMYKIAETKAKENNESSRARRFNRGLKTLENLLKKVKAGQAVAESDIPPVIALNLKPLPPVEVQTVQENIDDAKEVNDTNNAENNIINDQHQSSANNENNIMTTLLERLKMYQIAEEKAKKANELSRVRRFTRAIKTLENLVKKAKLGETVLLSDIPPEVALNLKPPPVLPPSEVSEIESDNESFENQMQSINLDCPEENSCDESKKLDDRDVIEILHERLDLYKTVEEKAKEAGEASRARRFSRGIKTLLELIEKAKAGEDIDLNEIPPAVALNLKQPSSLEPNISDDTEQEQPSGSAVEPIKFMAYDDDDDDDGDDSLDEELLDEKIPTTVMEGLEQRLRIYNKMLLKAKEKGNEALIKENEKIIKLYESSVETYKNGGFIDVLKLPTPRGCPPIPIPFQIV